MGPRARIVVWVGAVWVLSAAAALWVGRVQLVRAVTAERAAGLERVAAAVAGSWQRGLRPAMTDGEWDGILLTGPNERLEFWTTAAPGRELWMERGESPVSVRSGWLHLRRELPDGRALELVRSRTEGSAELAAYDRTVWTTVFPLWLVAGVLLVFLLVRILPDPRRLGDRLRAALDGSHSAGRLPLDGLAGMERELSSGLNLVLERHHEALVRMGQSLDYVAHDLRTPITRLRASAETALAGPGDAHHLREALADALEESQRVEAVLNTLMDVAEAEHATGSRPRSRVVLSAELDRIRDLYEIVAEENGVTLRVEIEQEAEVEADVPRLGQALANLVDNAVKYTPQGGTVTVRLFRQGDRAVIEVRDTGIGIGPDDLPRIWERFYRADRSRSRPGMGLGLSLVRAVVEAHGGTVTVESTPGRGSLFRINLAAV
jgi:signal transduction histidine kinase